MSCACLPCRHCHSPAPFDGRAMPLLSCRPAWASDLPGLTGPHSSRGPGHRPLKAETTGSNPVCGTSRAPQGRIRVQFTPQTSGFEAVETLCESLHPFASVRAVGRLPFGAASTRCGRSQPCGTRCRGPGARDRTRWRTHLIARGHARSAKPHRVNRAPEYPERRESRISGKERSSAPASRAPPRLRSRCP
jgi:hypothetical protein